MAIAFTTLTTATRTTTGTLTTGSVTPAANNLVLAAVTVADSTDPTGLLGTPSGCSLTWVSVGGPIAAGGDILVQLFRGMSAAPTTGTITCSVTGDSGGSISVCEFSGVDTTGTNGSGAVKQSKTATGSASSPTTALTSGVTAGNATYGVVCTANNARTVGTGYTQVHALDTAGSIATHLLTEYILVGQTTVDCSTGNDNWAIIGIEIAAPTTTTVRFPFQEILLAPRPKPLSVPIIEVPINHPFVFVPAGSAAGTGAANQPSISIASSGGNAAGTGAAGGPSASVAPTGGVATGTGVANKPAANVQPNAGSAAGVGAAYNPTISAIEYERPISDLSTGSWTVAPLWSKVNEVVADDSNFISSEVLSLNGNTTNADLRLTARGDPVSSSNQIISVRAQATFTLGLTAGIRVELRQGNNVTSTLIGTLTTNALTTSYATYTYTLSGAEADSITDYGDLFVRIYGSFGVGNLGGVQVSQVFFQQPAGVVPVDSVYPDPAAGTGTANQPSISVAGSVGVATGSGAAGGPSINLQPNPGVATGTGAAGGPSSSVAVSAGVATGTGTAYDAIPTSPDAHPGCATGIGQAYGPAILVTLPSGEPTIGSSGSRRGPHGYSTVELRAREEEEILLLI